MQHVRYNCPQQRSGLSGFKQSCATPKATEGHHDRAGALELRTECTGGLEFTASMWIPIVVSSGQTARGTFIWWAVMVLLLLLSKYLCFTSSSLWRCQWGQGAGHGNLWHFQHVGKEYSLSNFQEVASGFVPHPPKKPFQRHWFVCHNYVQLEVPQHSSARWWWQLWW